MANAQFFPPVYERFVMPARAASDIWRLVVGAVLAAVIFLFGTAAVIALVWTLTAPDADLMVWAADVGTPTTPFHTFLTLFGSFPMMALGVFAAARFLHKRPARTLFGRAPIVVRHFCVGAAIALGLSTLLFIPALFTGFDGVPNLDPSLWLALLPLTILGVLVQTGAEELAFRGYLQQQLAARFRSPLAWLVLPSILFGLVHYNPGLGANAWLPIVVASLFGLIAADLTAKSGSIGAAWGIHFANNFNGIAIIATDGGITGLSLYLTPYSVGDADLVSWSVLPSILYLVAAWYLIRRLVQR